MEPPSKAGILKLRVQDWYDERMENIIAQLLRAGVLTAAVVVIIGAALYLSAHARDPVNYRTFHSEPQALRTVHGIFNSAFSGEATGIMQLGLLLLIATPIARVVFSVFAFEVEGDYMYVAFTLVVLAVLLYSLFGSSLML
jgi:uncharacterized membrane protein